MSFTQPMLFLKMSFKVLGVFEVKITILANVVHTRIALVAHQCAHVHKDAVTAIAIGHHENCRLDIKKNLATSSRANRESAKNLTVSRSWRWERESKGELMH
jgi:hypothetical protein